VTGATGTGSGEPTPTATASPASSPACVGDCNGDGTVSVDEVLVQVNVGLGSAQLAACMSGDANHDAQITIEEMLQAINNALNGCTTMETP